MLTPTRARIALLVLALVMLAGLRSTSRIPPPPRDADRVGDLKLYELTVERLQSGVPYYAAVGGELRRHSYPTVPSFNWRTPLHYELLAALSIDRAAQVLAILAMVVVTSGTLVHATQSWQKGLIAAISLFGAMLPLMVTGPGFVLLAEAWAGVAIALSLNAYVVRRYEIGAACGVAAVFLRELAAPYALVCGLLAAHQRRWREFTFWAIGGVAYSVYYAIHWFNVSAAIQPGDLTHSHSWVRLLGLPFVFKTLYPYGWLPLLPAVVTPIAAAAGLAALATRSAAIHIRAALITYVLFFSVVGQPFDFYWGFVTTGIWAHAFVYSAEGLHALVRASRQTAIHHVPIEGLESVPVADLADGRHHDRT